MIFGVHISPTNDYMFVNFQLDIFTITCDFYVRTHALRNAAYRASSSAFTTSPHPPPPFLRRALARRSIIHCCSNVSNTKMMEISNSHISVNNWGTFLIFGVHIPPTNDYMLVNFQLDILKITWDIYVRMNAFYIKKKECFCENLTKRIFLWKRLS